MDYTSFAQMAFQNSAKNLNNLASSANVLQELVTAAEVIVESYKKGGCLYIAGNGGSAADAQHIAAEFMSKLDKDRTPIRAFALTVDTSLLTAIGNDYGYEKAFHRQVKCLVGPNDIFLGITTSGNSPNILEALKACRENKGKSILLTGRGGGKAKAENLADHVIMATGDYTAQVQEAHMVIYHTLCFMVEKALVEAGLVKYL